MKRFFVFFLAVVALLGAFLSVPLSASAAGVYHLAPPPVLEPIPTTKDNLVYDADDNLLFRHTQTNVVFNAKGEITFDDTSTPLFYNPATKQFTNGKNNVLSLFDRASTRGGKYLGNEGYKVRSVSIDDTFYELTDRDGATIHCSVLYSKAKKPWYEFMMQDSYYFEIYNLLGKKMAKSDLSSSVPSFLFETHRGVTRVISALAQFTGLSVKYPSNTLLDLLERIELANENATVLTPKDNRGKKINVVDGQLFDYFDYPLLGADSKPLFFDTLANGTAVYFGIDGRLLTIDHGGYLVDQGVRVHSVVTNLSKGELLYFLFMSDGVTICPLYGTPQKNSDGYFNGVVRYTYLNGEQIDEREFILPAVSEEDVYKRYPELRPVADTDRIIAAIGGFFDDMFLNIGNFFKNLGSSIGSFFNNFWPYLLAAVVALILVLSLGQRLLLSAVKGVGSGLLWLARQLLQLIIFIVSAPVHFFKWVFGK